MTMRMTKRRNGLWSKAVWLPACLWVWMSWAASAAAASYTVTAEQWASPRSGESVVAMDGLARAVGALAATPGSRLVLTHPEGEDGNLWAAELLAWLVSLGVGSSQIESKIDDASARVITLQVVPVVDHKGAVKP